MPYGGLRIQYLFVTQKTTLIMVLLFSLFPQEPSINDVIPKEEVNETWNIGVFLRYEYGSKGRDEVQKIGKLR